MLIPLKLVRDQPLQQQLYDQLRDLIAAGRLQPGTRMPSTRMLAEQFAVSRITVLLTYERLIADGHMETIPAKGTFVARPASPMARCPVAHGAHPATAGAPPCSGGIGEGRIGRPDPALFPVARWRALLRDTVGRLGVGSSADHVAGVVRLRSAIAGWLSASRGLAVAPAQIILVSGRQQAVHLAARMLLCTGARAVVEEPCDDRTASTYAEAGAEIVGVPVDHAGLRPDLLPEGAAALLHLTPEHQQPLGMLLSAERRAAVLEWATRAGATIVAEDCDGEFRYGGMEAPPLMNLDREGRVIQIGCFATPLGPWITMGYLAVPPAMVEAARAAKRLIDDAAGSVECAALAEFLESGAYARHVHRLRKTYLSRRDALLHGLHRHFGCDAVCSSGLHLAWEIPPEFDDPNALAVRARRCGLEADTVGTAERRVLLLGFGTLSEARLEAGLARLASETNSWARASQHAG
ncbi:MAG TPA: PLP-dependent aminotransferase family protein [Acetobacteraceae bacterium]|jgi:GntR family transcriptional regulator/MocR family aminotransferase